MTHKRIHRILLKFRALSWAAREVSVSKGTICRFLQGERPQSDRPWLKSALEALARKLLQTKGNAKDDVDGKSVRSQSRRLGGR